MPTAASALLLLSSPLLAQSSAPASASGWWRDYAEHARLVGIGGGRTLNLLCEGRGSPTIILESGTGDGMTVWRKVQPVLARHSRVCGYDRAGLGLSPPDLKHRDLEGMVSDLDQLTARARLRAPFILVSHSFGGMVVRLYARRNPSKVAGMVLVDPPSEGQTRRIANIVPRMERIVDQQIAQLRACAAARHLAGVCQVDSPQDAPPAVAARLASRARAHDLTAAAEMQGAIDGSDDAEIAKAGTDLGDVPLIVLTSEQFKTNSQMPPDVRSASQDLWMTFHNEIAAHSTRGSNRVVPGTGHYIQLERPDAVIGAVDEVVAAARKR
jgi:pimeloyl-ACP methyl ester carboxylesterase